MATANTVESAVTAFASSCSLGFAGTGADFEATCYAPSLRAASGRRTGVDMKMRLTVLAFIAAACSSTTTTSGSGAGGGGTVDIGSVQFDSVDPDGFGAGDGTGGGSEIGRAHV